MPFVLMNYSTIDTKHPSNWAMVDTRRLAWQGSEVGQ